MDRYSIVSSKESSTTSPRFDFGPRQAILRGLFNQQIHGSNRSLRSVEDLGD